MLARFWRAYISYLASMSATADNAPPGPASSYAGSLAGLEHKALCGQGSNQFKTSVTNPVCHGWQLSNATDAELPTYGAAYPDDYTSISSWFKTGKKACVAFADLQGQFNVDNFPTPYCATGKNGVNPETYACNWCEAGEKGCSGGNFIEEGLRRRQRHRFLASANPAKPLPPLLRPRYSGAVPEPRGSLPGVSRHANHHPQWHGVCPLQACAGRAKPLKSPRWVSHRRPASLAR
ncbi:hypothetical protein NKJ10_27845 [Mesorhizobium sp. M0204]|uniref:hypothetical protein n=1 Tax=Mesorhizobium sp. M0204 TaxID=2956913 RepID=UPI00333DD0F9